MDDFREGTDVIHSDKDLELSGRDSGISGLSNESSPRYQRTTDTKVSKITNYSVYYTDCL